MMNVMTLVYPVCGKETHLVFGLALSLSDVSGDDSLRLLPQSRKRSQLQMHTNKTHTYTLLQALRLHIPFQCCTLPRGITHHT